MSEAAKIAAELIELLRKTARLESGSHVTWSDEYPWRKPPRPGFKPVDQQQKAFWEQAANQQ